MAILLIILVIWNIILMADIRKLEKYINNVVRAADEMFEEKQRQIDYLREEIKKDTYFDDEPPL